MVGLLFSVLGIFILVLFLKSGRRDSIELVNKQAIFGPVLLIFTGLVFLLFGLISLVSGRRDGFPTPRNLDSTQNPETTGQKYRLKIKTISTRTQGDRRDGDIYKNQVENPTPRSIKWTAIDKRVSSGLVIRVSSVDDSDEDPEIVRKESQDGENISRTEQQGFQQEGQWTFPKRMWRNHENSETLPRGFKLKLNKTKWRRESTSSNSSTVTGLETGEQGKILEKNSLEGYGKIFEMKESNPVSGEPNFLWRKDEESSQNAGSTQTL
ncbi:uncharacterized protein LOC111698106 [Eurytemora carolleeae]|uniref:uncharacterized protein LOC111698106 n=1 Tax=Eurytemora carolleeae TaxID=1294199 RepID=UPI000C7759B3|nr:uncharacterized protein LOC111698106 [Eurytemora carolleeae]|eukprot:XP_023324122.1 uncharacterized protein LOC111698106 [Eurytemora affinis]